MPKPIPKLPLKHLTKDHHVELAMLLGTVQSALEATIGLVDRAPYTDQILGICRAVQMRLIDQLAEAWPNASGVEPAETQSPYRSVAYLGGPKRL